MTRPPYSDLASPESEQNLRDTEEGFGRWGKAAEGVDVVESRRLLDEILMAPWLERLRASCPVTIRHDEIAGVPVDVVAPEGGVPARNANRVLMNLHGGGFITAAGLGGQMESVPIASVGGFEVVTVDYRQGPEHRFPAASEDIAAVYRALLERYDPADIGIYGCSAGGALSTQAVAWFREHGLPRPGAIGVFGFGGVVGRYGDSGYMSAALSAESVPAETPARDDAEVPPDAAPEMPYFRGVDLTQPLVSPGLHPDVLRDFPPTLVISGTRDGLLSNALFLHSELVRVGVDARLHVWEGAVHCSFAQPIADADVPETRQAWDVIARFFDDRLGRHDQAG